MNITEFVLALKNLIAQDQTGEALKYLMDFLRDKDTDFYNDVILKNQQFTDLQRQINAGIIDPAAAATAKNQLTYHLMNLIDAVADDPALAAAVVPVLPRADRKRVFISYTNGEPDVSIARFFYQELSRQHHVFMAAASIGLGENWYEKIKNELLQCDYFILLVSEPSMESEMVTEEVNHVRKLRDSHPERKPVMLPVRVQLPFGREVNYELAGYLNTIQQKLWMSDADTLPILQEIKAIVDQGIVPDERPGKDIPKVIDTSRPIPNAPLEVPGGTVSFQSQYYIERRHDKECRDVLLNRGSLIRIKAPRQYGKTSLLSRLIVYARENNHAVVSLSFQQFTEDRFRNLNSLLRYLCTYATRVLQLPKRVDQYWEDEDMDTKDKCTCYFQEYLLTECKKPILLAIDEADRLFEYKDVSGEFFGMLRFWHEEAKQTPEWENLKIIISHATEGHYAIQNVNQSPFNVGLSADLKDFSAENVLTLAKLHYLNWTMTEVKQLMEMAGGHPYLVRKALYEIARGNFSLDTFLQTAAQDDGIYHDHLTRHLWILKEYPQLGNAMRQILQTGTTTDYIAKDALSAAGLVRGTGPNYQLSFKLYELYFKNKI